MRRNSIIPVLVFGILLPAGISAPVHAAGAGIHHNGLHHHGGQLLARHDRVTGTNTGHSRYFAAPRSHTYGSVPPRLGPGGVYDRSVKPRHHGHGHGRQHGHQRHHFDRHDPGYRHGYRDGYRDGRRSSGHRRGR